MLFSNLWQAAFSFPIISSSPGTSIGQDFVSMVAFLRCSSQAGREGSTPTWCSIGSTDVAHGRPDVVQVWRSEARPRGNAEKDCQLHWLCFNWGPDPGILEKILSLWEQNWEPLSSMHFQRLNEHMKFDNYQKSSSKNKKDPNWWETLK